MSHSHVDTDFWTINASEKSPHFVLLCGKSIKHLLDACLWDKDLIKEMNIDLGSKEISLITFSVPTSLRSRCNYAQFIDEKNNHSSEQLRNLLKMTWSK